MARLVYMDPEGRQQTLELGAETPQIVVGRHPDCDLVSDDTSVSRRHCIITYEGGHYRVADLGSANGTQVNDQRVTRKNLSTRDIVRCGNLLLQFFDEPDLITTPPAALPPPQPFGRVPFGQGAIIETSVASPVQLDAGRLQARIRTLEDLNQGQAQRLAELQRELALAGERVDAALGHATESETEARELREQVWRAEELLRSRSAALEAREAELAALRRRVPGVGFAVGAPAAPVPVDDVMAREDSPTTATPLIDAVAHISRLDAEVEALRESLRSEQAAAEERAARLAEREAELARLRDEREGLEHRLAEAERLTPARGEFERVAARADELESALERRDAELAAAEAARREALAAKEGLEARVSAADASLERMRTERLTATSARAAELAAAKARAAELERSLQDTKRGEEEARAALAEARKSLEQVRADAEAERAMAAAARKRHTDDSTETALRAGQTHGELEALRARTAELEAALARSEELLAERDARAEVLEAGRARAERALEERDRALAAEAEASAQLAALREAHESMKREEAALRSALHEAREESRTAGQVRKALREAQGELERLRAQPVPAPDLSLPPKVAPSETELAELREANDRIAAMETRIRQTERALAEAEGRAQEAQTALLQVREAERAARETGSPDRATADRMNQMSVKLAGVTRRAQQADELAAAARRAEERAAALDAELAELRRHVAEAEAERDHAAATTLALIAEKRAADEELGRTLERLRALEARAPAEVGPAASWPTWMDDHMEMLGDLLAQFRTDMSHLAGLWAGLQDARPVEPGKDAFSVAVDNARAGADSLAEATAVAREAMDQLRRSMGAGFGNDTTN